QAELDLRSLKVTLGMDVLRCQSPEMVRKEVWAHLLAYNVIRGQMAQAAQEGGLFPVQLSFKGAVQGLTALSGWLGRAVGTELAEACRQLRALLASYRLE